jgi:hypothetical protein
VAHKIGNSASTKGNFFPAVLRIVMASANQMKNIALREVILEVFSELPVTLAYFAIRQMQAKRSRKEGRTFRGRA